VHRPEKVLGVAAVQVEIPLFKEFIPDRFELKSDLFSPLLPKDSHHLSEDRRAGNGLTGGIGDAVEQLQNSSPAQPRIELSSFEKPTQKRGRIEHDQQTPALQRVRIHAALPEKSVHLAPVFVRNYKKNRLLRVKASKTDGTETLDKSFVSLIEMDRMYDGRWHAVSKRVLWVRGA
jgi:hypothetical protein